jgi:hypothetical protein
LAGQHNDEAFAYLYINRNDSSRWSPSAALCSLARQLALSAKGQALQRTLVQLYKAKRQCGMADSILHEAKAKQLLNHFIDVYPQTTIVLDALDECDAKTRMGLVKTLDGLVRGAGWPIKIFMSSRLYQDIASLA